MTEPEPAVRVGPGTRAGERAAFAARAFSAGDFIARFEGTETARRTQMSLQFGADRHIEPGLDHPLRFLNHACDPNAAFGGGSAPEDLHALRAIPPGTEITIDYNCHEAELAAPFACGCGAPGCVGMVLGWLRLRPPERAARVDRAGAWLKPR